MSRSLIALMLGFIASTLLAQVPEMPKPTKSHEWLKQFVGEWEADAEGLMGPGQTVKCKGSMKYRMMGDFWLVHEGVSEMPGMKVSYLSTLGFDTEKKKYIGTWADSAMNHLWIYEGTVDDTGKSLSLNAEGPDMTKPGKKAKYQDVYTFKTADHIVQESKMLGDDGKWITFMTSQIKRKVAK